MYLVSLLLFYERVLAQHQLTFSATTRTCLMQAEILFVFQYFKILYKIYFAFVRILLTGLLQSAWYTPVIVERVLYYYTTGQFNSIAPAGSLV